MVRVKPMPLAMVNRLLLDNNLEQCLQCKHNKAIDRVWGCIRCNIGVRARIWKLPDGVNCKYREVRDE